MVNGADEPSDAAEVGLLLALPNDLIESLAVIATEFAAVDEAATAATMQDASGGSEVLSAPATAGPPRNKGTRSSPRSRTGIADLRNTADLVGAAPSWGFPTSLRHAASRFVSGMASTIQKIAAPPLFQSALGTAASNLDVTLPAQSGNIVVVGDEPVFSGRIDAPVLQDAIAPVLGRDRGSEFQSSVNEMLGGEGLGSEEGYAGPVRPAIESVATSVHAVRRGRAQRPQAQLSMVAFGEPVMPRVLPGTAPERDYDISKRFGGDTDDEQKSDQDKVLGISDAGPTPNERGLQEDSGGAVILDGRLVGEWMTDRMARDALRPGAGTTFFDGRQGPAWTPSGAW